MNLFRVHQDPSKLRKQLCDSHVSVGPKELAQVISMAMRQNGYDPEWSYGDFVPTHPIVLWAAESHENFNDLVSIAREVSQEYEYRYGRKHSSYVKVIQNVPATIEGFDWSGYTEQPPIGECGPRGSMCDECLVDGDLVESYRNQYRVEKKRFNPQWTKRPVPGWYNE